MYIHGDMNYHAVIYEHVHVCCSLWSVMYRWMHKYIHVCSYTYLIKESFCCLIVLNIFIYPGLLRLKGSAIVSIQQRVPHRPLNACKHMYTCKYMHAHNIRICTEYIIQYPFKLGSCVLVLCTLMYTDRIFTCT